MSSYVPDVHSWESRLVEELTARQAEFTAYPEYFRLRCNELRVVRGLLPHLFRRDQHENALEIGCGFGFQSALLSPYCRRLTGIDIPVEYDGYVPPGQGTSVELARKLVNEELGLRHVSFAHAWPQDIDASDDAFDFVYSAYVLEHVPDIHALMVELARVVRPGGVMVHVVPSVVDALFVLARTNLAPPWRQLIGGVLRRRQPRHRLGSTGVIVPPPHSEFLRDFVDQFDVYQLERSLFPAVESGFVVECVTQSRSWNHVVVLRRTD